MANVQNLVNLESLILIESESAIKPDAFLSYINRLLACDPDHTEVTKLHTFKIALPLCTRPQIVELLAHDRLKTLQHLGLMDCREIDDQIAALIASTGKRLRTLQLPNSKITGVGLKKLVLACPSLAAIDINGCGSLSMDAVDWARAQGISVAWKMGA